MSMSNTTNRMSHAFYSLLDRMYENMPESFEPDTDEYVREVESDVNEAVQEFKEAEEEAKKSEEISKKNEWSVRGYRKDGSLKEEKTMDSELDCAKYCVAQLRMGYPAPTVWHNGERIEGY